MSLATNLTALATRMGAESKSLRTLANDKVAKGTLVFNVRDYGATGLGTNDDMAAIQRAIEACSAKGGGTVYFPIGTYNVADHLIPRSNVNFDGDGYDSVLRIPPGNSTRNNIISSQSTSSAWIANIRITNLRFEGRWEEFQSQITTNTNGFIMIKYCRNLIIDNCHFRNSRFFSLNINICEDITISNCRFQNGARDFCAIWATPRTSIVDNKFEHNDDDCISVNYEASSLTPPTPSSIVITGNHLVDTGPIRTQAPKGVIIANNTIFRPKGQGILMGVRNHTDVDNSAGHSNIVANNVIRDVIDRYWFVDGSATSANLRVYIQIHSIPVQTGTHPVEPGQVNPATSKVHAPYEYNYSHSTLAGNVGPQRRAHGIIVTGNVCKRTLPAVAKYSDWGFGGGYTMSGWEEYQVTEEHMRGCGVRVTFPIKDVLISDNILECGRWGVFFERSQENTSTNNMLNGIRIVNNTIKDFDTIGIGWSETVLTHQDVIIDGNILDGDPLFRVSARQTNGSWFSAAVPFAINVPHMGGAMMMRNVFSNVGKPIEGGSGANFQHVSENIVVADPAGSGFNTNNKGIAWIPQIGNGAQYWLVSRNCDPSSADYNASLGSNTRNNHVMPTTGKWLSGSVVMATPGAPVNGKVLIGWLRLTTGAGHVAGTDWQTLYATTT